MIFSKSQKTLVLNVPKTGTITCANFLASYRKELSPFFVGLEALKHTSYSELSHFINNPPVNGSGVPVELGLDLNSVEKVYLFWRDPVQRFISGANFIRSKNVRNLLFRRKPEWFAQFNPAFVMSKEQEAEISEFAKTITPEQVFNEPILMDGTIFKPQSYWHRDVPKDKLVVLDFAQFESGMRTIAADFGVPVDVPIPKLNESQKLTTALSPELEAAVQAYYAEDYALKPI